MTAGERVFSVVRGRLYERLPALALPLPQGSHLTVKRLTPVMERQLMLACRKNRSLSTAAQALWEIVREEGANLTAARVEDPLYQR